VATSGTLAGGGFRSTATNETHDRIVDGRVLSPVTHRATASLRTQTTGACYDASEGGDLCGLIVSASDVPALLVASWPLSRRWRLVAALGSAPAEAAVRPTRRASGNAVVFAEERRSLLSLLALAALSAGG
jgi:hypothetical protein